jgi:hypothetical protein
MCCLLGCVTRLSGPILMSSRRVSAGTLKWKMSLSATSQGDLSIFSKQTTGQVQRFLFIFCSAFAVSAYTVARSLVTNSFIITTGWVVTGWLEACCEAEEDIEHTMRPTRPAVWSCQREPLVSACWSACTNRQWWYFLCRYLNLGLQLSKNPLALTSYPW